MRVSGSRNVRLRMMRARRHSRQSVSSRVGGSASAHTSLAHFPFILLVLSGAWGFGESCARVPSSRAVCPMVDTFRSVLGRGIAETRLARARLRIGFPNRQPLLLRAFQVGDPAWAGFF